MALSMRGIVKSFDANRVLKNVDFSVNDGEIRALIGENGAGKTTLMNILGGVLQPDEGEIAVNGKKARFLVPGDSIAAGVAFIHQELNLVNDLCVYENLFLGREYTKNGFLDRRRMIVEAGEVLSRLDIDVDCKTMLRELDASYKQIIEIARALLMKATVIIMDEPTTSLTEIEIERVFRLMRTLRDQGVSLVFISHKLKEVLSVCDTYTVLRDGEVVVRGDVADTNEVELARHMVGHDVRTEKLGRKVNLGEEALRVERLCAERQFSDISFSLRRGEILGFTGLLGDGRSELFQTIFGLNPGYGGSIFVSGKRMRMNSTSEAYRAGIGYVPRNRKENGIIRDMSILHNGSIVTYEELKRFLFIDRRRELSNMEKNREELSIKMGDMSDPITSLSGGNQQKVVLAKWLSANPRVLIFDNPTQGVDVGAKEEIYDIILRLAENGVAIAILSSEAQEVIRLCDRAIVLYHGRTRGELSGGEMNERNIMILATGGDIAREGAKERLSGDMLSEERAERK